MHDFGLEGTIMISLGKIESVIIKAMDEETKKKYEEIVGMDLEFDELVFRLDENESKQPVVTIYYGYKIVEDPNIRIQIAKEVKENPGNCYAYSEPRFVIAPFGMERFNETIIGEFLSNCLSIVLE